MRKFRFWAAGLLIIVIVAIAGLAIAPAFVDKESYRASVLTTIESATGGTARLGAIHLRFLPPATMTIEQLVINDGPDERAGASLTARTVEARLALGSLLGGVIRITEVRAYGVALALPGVAPIEITVDRLIPGDTTTTANLSATLGNLTAVHGTVSFAHTDPPIVRFDLSTPLLDLGAIESIQSTRPPRPDEPLASPGQPRLLAEGHFRAKRVRLPRLEASDADAPVRVFTDHIEVAPISARFYDGTLEFTAQVDRTAKPATFTTDVHVANANLGQVVAALGSNARVTGSAGLSLMLSGQFGDGLIDSLAGQGALDVRDGTVPGFRASGLMGTVARMQDAVTFGAGTDQYADTIPYRSFMGDITIAAGHVTSKRLVLDSPAGAVSMHGNVTFDQHLHYDGLAALVRGNRPTRDGPLGNARDLVGSIMSNTVGRVRIPFAIRGAVTKPRIGPGL